MCSVMLNVMKIIQILITIQTVLRSTHTKTDITNPKSCPYNEISEPEKSICCENLNKKRTEFASCCKYPILVINRDHFESCTKNCTDPKTNASPERCCIMSCCFRKLGILTEDAMNISIEGLINSFMMSVNNNSSWKEPITEVVRSCAAAIIKPPGADEHESYWDCFEKIPYYLYDIVDCSYDYNFLRCPNFPFNISSCYETYYYIFDCFLNGSDLLATPLVDPRIISTTTDSPDGNSVVVLGNWTFDENSDTNTGSDMELNGNGNNKK